MCQCLPAWHPAQSLSPAPAMHPLTERHNLDVLLLLQSTCMLDPHPHHLSHVIRLAMAGA